MEINFSLQPAVQGDGEDSYVLHYIPEQKQYDYDSTGRLISVRGKGPKQAYRPIYVHRITLKGYEKEWQYDAPGRVVGAKDVG